MRENSNIEKIKTLMIEMGRNISQPVNIYLTGGATAVLLGFRNSTVDVDMKFDPDISEKFTVIRDLKEKLKINLELASPDDFVPPLPGWEQRREFIGQYGKVTFFHFDPYTQVLAKVERGWELDKKDVKNLLKHSVDIDKLVELFRRVKEDFIKYPGADPEKTEKELMKLKHEFSKRHKP